MSEIDELRQQIASLRRRNEELERTAATEADTASRLRAVIANLPVVAFALDRDGVFTLSEGRVLERVGLSAGERVGMSFYDIWASRPDWIERLRRVLRDGAVETWTGEVRGVLFESIVHPTRDASGAIDGAIGVSIDVTERRRVESALAASREDRDAAQALLAALVTSSEDGIISVDLQGRVTSWNRGATRLYGWTADEILGRPLSLLVPRDRAEELDELAAGADGTVQIETTRVRKDGTRVEVALSRSPIRDASGAIIGYSGIIRDLTDKRVAEAALRRTEEQLRQSQRLDAVGRLAGGVAHDFNNLLSVILGYASMALDELPPEDPLRADFAEIKAAAERASELTRQLLAFGRKQVLQPRVLDLNEVVAGMRRMFERVLGEDVAVEVGAAPDLDRVFADPGQIEHVLMNLVVNARDAMPAGGRVRIETANVDVDAAFADDNLGLVAGRYVRLSVIDSGTGMDDGTRARVFEPFFTTKELGRGTGLGLSTVLGIVQQSGGTVVVDSKTGVGSRFDVYLPRTDRNPGRQAMRAKSRHTTETILLVEDEPQVRNVVALSLRRHGYHVLEAGDGVDALRVAADWEDRIHLLITDVVMPRMGGRELSEKLTAVRPTTKVLFVSGYTGDAIVRHGLPDVGQAFLQKPFTPDTLLRKVRELL